jgi:very-short-patch-repair endonuclease
LCEFAVHDRNMHRFTTAISDIATRTGGIVTTPELKDLGLTRDQVLDLTRSGFLHRKRRGIFLVGHCALSREARWRAAIAAGGDGAVLAGRAAAQLWGIDRQRSDRIDLIVPRERRPIDGVELYVTELEARDHTVHRGLPVTSVARTLLDLSRTGMSADALTFVFHEAAYHELLDLREVDDLLARARGRRGMKNLRSATNAHRAGRRGTRSAFERRVAMYLSRCGAPRPELGVPIQVGNETFEVDMWWPGRQLIVEIDGPGHDRPATRREDERRTRALKRAGNRLIRITLADFEADPAGAVRPVLVALGVIAP